MSRVNNEDAVKRETRRLRVDVADTGKEEAAMACLYDTPKRNWSTIASAQRSRGVRSIKLTRGSSSG
jgi:hypothetical protein